jgi:hypothetical protein
MRKMFVIVRGIEGREREKSKVKKKIFFPVLFDQWGGELNFNNKNFFKKKSEKKETGREREREREREKERDKDFSLVFF